MQPNNRSSFIPKKSISRTKRVRSSKQVYLLSYVAYAIFFATLIAIVAVFFYARVLESQLEEKIAELESQRVAFSEADIQRVKEVERQLRISEYLFNIHASPYAILNEIESLAVNSVAFTSFSYQRISDELATIEVAGGSNRFDSVAFQHSLLKGAALLSGALFEDLSKDGSLAQISPNQPAGNTPAVDDDEPIITPVSFSVNKEVPVSELKLDMSIYEVTPVTPTAPVSTPTDSEGDGTAAEGSEGVSDQSETEVIDMGP